MRGPAVRPYWAKLMRSATAKVATVSVELRRGLSRQPSAPNARRIGLRSARRELAAMHRVPRLAAVYGGLQQPRSNPPPIAVAVRSPPSEARASPRSRSRANQPVAFLVDQVLRSHNLPNGCRSAHTAAASRHRPIRRFRRVRCPTVPHPVGGGPEADVLKILCHEPVCGTASTGWTVNACELEQQLLQAG